ncbi:MAG: glycerate kinase [Symbiobacteriaceae bacterium]|nr:glycerate kinase [Symbiobacteriaceae bacterium]
MKKIIIIPDSFKGTMSSLEICSLTAAVLHQHFPAAQIVTLPIADGGEGSVEAILSSLGGRLIDCTVQGPYGEEMLCRYGIVADGRTAVIEMASCAGLPLVGERRHPGKTTTYGVGQQIADAVMLHGCRRVILGLGGSATNDLGCGAAAALGVVFRTRDGSAFIPTGETLSQISRIETNGLLAELAATEIIAICDIDNPLYGSQGAAYIFGPQKGADPAMVAFLDKQLRAASEVIYHDLGIDIADLPGAGAAGGMGGGMVAFLGAKLQMGIETILDMVSFAEIAKDADLILTGEGKLDQQSLRGKVVVGVGRRAKALGVPVIAIVGDIADGMEAIYVEGITAVMSINRIATSLERARLRSRSDLTSTIDTLCRVLKISNSL